MAEQAVPTAALGSIAWDDEVTGLIVGDTLADIVDDSSGLVAEDGWELSFRVLSRLCVHICMAECIGDDLHSNFAKFGWGHLHVYDLEWLVRSENNGGFAHDHSGSRFLAFDHLNMLFGLLFYQLITLC